MPDALTRERVREALAMLPRNHDTLCASHDLDDCDCTVPVYGQLLAALDDPARWCAIVGDVDTAAHDTLRLVHTGDVIVTPHQEGA